MGVMNVMNAMNARRLFGFLAAADAVFSAVLLVCSTVAIVQRGLWGRLWWAVIIACVFLGLLLWGLMRRTMWIFLSGLAGVVVTIPAPFGLVPVWIGLALIGATFGLVLWDRQHR